MEAKRGETSVLTGEKGIERILSHTHPTLLQKESLAPFIAPFSLHVEEKSATLNLLPLVPYLFKRFALKEYDSSGEVEVSYLYPTTT